VALLDPTTTDKLLLSGSRLLPSTLKHYISLTDLRLAEM
jgi:hypothetical protein